MFSALASVPRRGDECRLLCREIPAMGIAPRASICRCPRGRKLRPSAVGRFARFGFGFSLFGSVVRCALFDDASGLRALGRKRKLPASVGSSDRLDLEPLEIFEHLRPPEPDLAVPRDADETDLPLA